MHICATHDMKSNPSYDAHLHEYTYREEPLNKSTRNDAQDQVPHQFSPVQNSPHCSRLQSYFNCSASCRLAAAATPASKSSITCSLESGQSQERSLYATPLLVGQVPHTHNDATPAPYLTPSVQSTNRRLPPPPHYEDVKDLSRGVQHDSEFVDSFPLQISSHQRALKYDIHPYAITQSSEITLISETEV